MSDFKKGQVELAKSDRSTCTHCRDKIPKSELRIASLVKSDKHSKCFFASENKCEWAKDDFKGFMDLRPDDKKQIEEWLGGAEASKRPAKDDGGKGAAKKPKTETAADKKVREHDEKLWTIRDQLAKAKSSSVLKAILEYNGVSSRGNDVTLAGRCADIMLHGVPGRCPVKIGAASDESGSIKVQGSAPEPYTVTAVRRKGETAPFKIKCTCPAYELNGKTCKHQEEWQKIKQWSKAAALTCGARLRYDDGHFKCHAYIDTFTPCSYNQPMGPREAFAMPPAEERGSGGKELDAYLDKFVFKKVAVPKEMLDDIRQQDKAQKQKESERASAEDDAEGVAKQAGVKGKKRKGPEEEEETVTLTLDLDSTGGQVSNVDADAGKDKGTHKVLTCGDTAYSCVLNRADIAKRKNSFYKLQIVEHTVTGQTWLFKKWGAIGSKGGGVEGGDHRVLDGSVETCIEMFEEEFQKRTGNR